MGLERRGSEDGEARFNALVKITGINPYVDVPERVVKALGGARKVAVLVKVAGTGPVKDEASAAPGKARLERNVQKTVAGLLAKERRDA